MLTLDSNRIPYLLYVGERKALVNSVDPDQTMTEYDIYSKYSDWEHEHEHECSPVQTLQKNGVLSGLTLFALSTGFLL